MQCTTTIRADRGRALNVGRLVSLGFLIAAAIGARSAGAIAGQRPVKPEAPPPRLISELRSKNAVVRRDAANQLGATRARGAVRALVEGLSDKDASVREAAAFALGQIADPAAAPLLIPLLADPDSEVRSSAAFALGMIGERKALQALSYATGDPSPEVRSSAIVALGLMQDAGGVDEITEALDDPSYDVRYDAVWALGQIGEPDVEEQLQGSLVTLDLIRIDGAWREAYRQALQNSLESLRTEAHARMAQETPTRARRATGIIRDNRYASTTRAIAIKQSVKPATTERAARTNVSGSVRLRVLVGADGRAVRAYVTRRLGYGLDQRAVETVLQYKFDPELLGGLPQTTWVDLEIKF
ncbi:MAG TPA: TonB family protein [Blastocatellia bacterium]|nr:TonB family protein [Blastocatellia bacterium]